MKIWVDGKIHDSEKELIVLNLDWIDKINIKSMPRQTHNYARFPGKITEPLRKTIRRAKVALEK